MSVGNSGRRLEINWQLQKIGGQGGGWLLACFPTDCSSDNSLCGLYDLFLDPHSTSVLFLWSPMTRRCAFFHLLAARLAGAYLGSAWLEVGKWGLGRAGPGLGAARGLLPPVPAPGHCPWDVIDHLSTQWW